MSREDEFARLFARAENLSDRYDQTGDLNDLNAALGGWNDTLTAATNDIDRAAVLNNRASRLSDRYGQIGNVEDLDAAIVDMDDALRLTPPDHPIRPQTLNNRAGRLSDRYDRVGNIADLEASIASLNDALDLTLADSPSRAGRLYNRAGRLLDRYERNGDIADLDAALADLREALARTSADARERPGRLDDYAIGLSDRYDRTGNVDDLRAALAAWDEALELARPGDPHLPRYLSNRSSGLSSRYRLTGDLDDLNAALDDMIRTLALTSPGSPERAGRLANRSNWLSARFRRTGDIADLDAALEDMDEALRLVPPGNPNRPSFLGGRANRFGDRHARTGKVADLDRALADVTEALGLTHPTSPDRPGRLNDLASSHLLRHSRTGDVRDATAALAAINEALQLTPAGSPNLAGRLSIRAQCLWKLNRLTRGPSEMESALAVMNEALSLSPRGSPDRAGHLHNLASMLADSCADTHSAADRDAGVAAFREACSEGLTMFPEATVGAARSWLSWAVDRAAWDEATEAGAFGLDAGDRLVRVQAIRTAKESRLRDVQGLAARTAYAWAKRQDGEKAVVAAERGRAVLLAEAFQVEATLDRLAATGRSDLGESYRWAALRLADNSALPSVGEPGHPAVERDLKSTARIEHEAAITAIQSVPGFEDFLQQQSDDEILADVAAGASTSAIVYLMSGPADGLALMVRNGKPVEIIELPDLTDWALTARMSTYLEAYRSLPSDDLEAPRWLSVLDNLTGWLGTAVGLPLLSGLKAAGMERATLIPMGALGLLPLHAAWVEVSSQETDRRYMLDDLLISYAPNARAIGSLPQDTAITDGSILAVDEPWPVDAPSIKGSAALVAAAVALFPGRATVLRHQQATRKQVLDDTAGHAVIHLSCHGNAVAEKSAK